MCEHWEGKPGAFSSRALRDRQLCPSRNLALWGWLLCLPLQGHLLVLAWSEQLLDPRAATLALGVRLACDSVGVCLGSWKVNDFLKRARAKLEDSSALSGCVTWAGQFSLSPRLLRPGEDMWVVFGSRRPGGGVLHRVAAGRLEAPEALCPNPLERQGSPP